MPEMTVSLLPYWVTERAFLISICMSPSLFNFEILQINILLSGHLLLRPFDIRLADVGSITTT